MQVAAPARTAAIAPGLTPDAAARLRRLPADEQVRAVSGQFEAILLRQFLQDSVGKLMQDGNGGSGGPGGGMYGYLLTDALAGQIAASGGLGLSSVVAQQLGPRVPSTKEAKP